MRNRVLFASRLGRRWLPVTSSRQPGAVLPKSRLPLSIKRSLGPSPAFARGGNEDSWSLDTLWAQLYLSHVSLNSFICQTRDLGEMVVCVCVLKTGSDRWRPQTQHYLQSKISSAKLGENRRWSAFILSLWRWVAWLKASSPPLVWKDKPVRSLSPLIGRGVRGFHRAKKRATIVPTLGKALLAEFLDPLLLRVIHLNIALLFGVSCSPGGLQAGWGAWNLYPLTSPFGGTGITWQAAVSSTTLL